MEAIMARRPIPPTPTGSDYTAARTFARLGWRTVWAALYRYATGTLGFAAIGARRAGVVEAAEVVNTLALSALAGTLDWSLPEHATDEQIMGHACMKLYGMRSTLRRKAARAACDDGLDERPDPGPDALTRLVVARGLLDLERILRQDPEASAYLGWMLEGKTREEIMAKVGCTAKRADVVRKRILRSIAAHVRRTSDAGADEP
jgi:hypothetical protein